MRTGVSLQAEGGGASAARALLRHLKLARCTHASRALSAFIVAGIHISYWGASPAVQRRCVIAVHARVPVEKRAARLFRRFSQRCAALCSAVQCTFRHASLRHDRDRDRCHRGGQRRTCSLGLGSPESRARARARALQLHRRGKLRGPWRSSAASVP